MEKQLITNRLSIIGMDALVANTTHLQQIIDLYRSFYSQTFRVSPDIFHSTILTTPKTQWMLAIVDTFNGMVVGIVNANIEYSFLYNCQSICNVTDFIVHEEYRRQKVGTWILEHLEHYARRHSCRILRFISARPSELFTPFFTHHEYTIVQPSIAERYLGNSGSFSV